MISFAFFSSLRLSGQNPTDIDQGIGDHAESNPSIHSVLTTITTPIQSVSLFKTLIRPSQPVRHFCPFRNHRVFCIFRMTGFFVGRFGTEMCFTPISCTAAF